MIIDAQLLFSDAQAITATAASTNVIDTGPLTGPAVPTANLGRNLGAGENLYVVIVVTTAFTDADSDSTVAVTLETDDNAAFTSATVFQTIGTLGALSAVGARIVARLQPEGSVLMERYLRLNYTVAGGSLTTGAVTAFINHDVDLFKAYRNGFAITAG